MYKVLLAYNAVLHIKYGYSGGKYHRHHIKLLPYKSINSVVLHGIPLAWAVRRTVLAKLTAICGQADSWSVFHQQSIGVQVARGFKRLLNTHCLLHGMRHRAEGSELGDGKSAGVDQPCGLDLLATSCPEEGKDCPNLSGLFGWSSNRIPGLRCAISKVASPPAPRHRTQRLISHP